MKNLRNFLLFFITFFGFYSSALANSSDLDALKSKAQTAIDEVNKYLATYANGYYGYLEVKSDNLYDRLKSGKYLSAKLSDLDKAVVIAGTSDYFDYVNLKCKNGQNCIYSSVTNKYVDKISFSQIGPTNTDKLIELLNNFLTACNNYYTYEQNINAQKELNNIKEVDNVNTPKYATALKNLNDYLKIFNPSTYDDVDIKDGKVNFNFKFSNLKYKVSININDLANNTDVSTVSDFFQDEVRITCKNNQYCFYSTYNEDYTDYFRFFSHSVNDLSKMEQLLKDFIAALK